MMPSPMSAISILPSCRCARSGRTIALMICSMLVACTTGFDMSGERIPPPGPEWGVVIGSVLVHPEADQTGAVPATRNPATYSFDVVQIQPGDPDGTRPYAQQYELSTKSGEERPFVSRLRPGQYLVRSFHKTSMAGLGGDLNVVFSVEPGEVRYVGRLNVEIPFSLSRGKDYRFRIDNVRAQTFSLLPKEHVDLATGAMDSPMQVRTVQTP